MLESVEAALPELRAWLGELSVPGRLIEPVANRCVFLKGGTPHEVLQVRGPAPRMSVIGYTRRPARPRAA